MVKVQLIRLDERHEEYATQEEKDRVGEIFEAFVINDEYQQDERYKTQYALNLHKCVWFVPADCCEVVEGLTTMENNSKDETHKPNRTGGVLLVEDGSVDIDYIQDDLGIPCIVYRQGAKKPEWLEY